MTARIPLSAAAVLLTAAVPASGAAPYYTISDLTPDGYTTSVAYDINADGDAVGVAGSYATGSLVEAFFYYDHSTGTSTPFGVGTVKPRSSIVGTGFRGAAINDSGAVAGTAMFAGGPAESRGFIYSGPDSGAFTDLGVLAGATATGIRPASDALDINSAGVAVGTASSGAGTNPTEADNIDIYKGTAAPISDIDGDITVGTRYDYGRALNDAGLVAGSNQDNKATLFDGAAETVLLTGTPYAGEASVAVDLNEAGQVAGSTVATNKAFVYDPSGGVTILPQIGTGARMNAKAINEAGDVVGQGDRNTGVSGQSRGYVYSAAEGASYILEDHVVDLSTPAVAGLSDWGQLGTAWGINDSGWIVGQGDRRFDGDTFPTPRAYLLLPAPAPTGDLTGDGSYGGDDFLAWQRSATQSEYSRLQLAHWEANYGVAPPVDVRNVPEPSAAALAGVFALGFLALQRRRR